MNERAISDDRKRVNAWLHQSAIRSHLEIELNDEGLCAIGHASGIDCALELPEGSGKLYLRAPLLSLHQVSATSLRKCLAEHLLGVRTGGAIFSIDEQEDCLLLWQDASIAQLDAQSFAQWLVDFLRTASFWQEQLLTLPAAPASAAAATNPASASAVAPTDHQILSQRA
jgi:hypothetical protein